MPTVSVKDGKVDFSGLDDDAMIGEFVTRARDGKSVAVIVSVETPEIARTETEGRRA